MFHTTPLEKYEAYRRLGFENAVAINEARAELVSALRGSDTLQTFRSLRNQPVGFAVQELASRLRTEDEFVQLKAGLT